MVRLVTVGCLLALAVGCNLTEYDSVELACADGVPGEEFLEPGTADFIRRANCYRRFVNLDEMFVHEGVQAGTADHADYLQVNGILDPSSPNFGNGVFIESPRLNRFTGASVFDRLAYHNATPVNQQFLVWDVFLGDVSTASADEMVDIPFFRDALFQPALLGAGYAEFEAAGVTYGYLNVVYASPASRRVDWPIVYPEDRQTDVPTTYYPAQVEGNPLYVAPEIGYPISVTLGSYEVGGGANPYNVRVAQSSLYGPEGKVPLITVTPGFSPYGDMPSTIVFAPARPLEPNSQYEFTAEITWNAAAGKIVQAVFTTGDVRSSLLPGQAGPPQAFLRRNPVE